MRKLFLLFISILFAAGSLYGLNMGEPVGGVATALGGVVLDRDLGGFNVLYNPSMIAQVASERSYLDFSASYAPTPFELPEIQNAAFGVSSGLNIGFMNVGMGLGAKMLFVTSGISEYNINIVGAGYYPIDVLFINGVAAGVGFKLNMFTVDDASLADLWNDITVSATGVDLDFDVTLKLFNDILSVGFMVSDILESKVSFFEGDVSTITKRGMIIHGKVAILKDFHFFTAFNLSGEDKHINRRNFTGSSTGLANTYFGIEASFFESLFVRVGVNEGQLSGGLGVVVEDLSVNVGVLPMPGLSLYYQVDISYRLGFGKRSSVGYDD
jgi:hypothetical protein